MMSDCVEVAVRVRPLVGSEIQRGSKNVLQVIPELEQIQIINTDKAFTFNYVLDSCVSQHTFYKKCIEKKIDELFKGYNLTILAYGQTGSGKTFSMGTAYNGEDEKGVIPRAVYDIFNICRDNFAYDFNVRVSFMELYQEVLYDLLAEKAREQCILDIREDSNKEIVIPGLTEKEVTNAQEALKFLSIGSSSRATSCTNMNSQSSRSHAIFTVNISMQHKQQSNLNKTAKFHLVDLAGSERPKKTGATGQTFREGVNINKGLLVLGNVISALGDEKQQHSHIPYRDSNLTRLLKDSLGGNSITLMIACVSPADYNLDETMSTLRYADRAKRIKNKPIVNQDPKAAEINRLNKLVQQLRMELVGQGGPVMCQAEVELLKSQNEHLKTKNIDLTAKLSSTLNNNTALLERVVMMQACNEKLTEKLLELKNQYDITLNNLNLSLENNDVTAVKDNISKLENIQKQFTEIDREHHNNEEELRSHDVHLVNTTHTKVLMDSTAAIEINEKQELHTAQQVAMNHELQQLMQQLALKEHLAQQIQQNACHMVDYDVIKEHESKIALLEKEKDELLQHLRNATSIGPSSKVAEQRRKQVQELEMKIQDLRKKVQEQARLIKMKEKDEEKIKQLNREIMQMKQTKVKLIKDMRQESEKFRVWKIQRERELCKLKSQDIKRQNQIVKMEAMHNRQQNVLKRKMEEVAAVNKRLKDALAVRKAAQDVKNTDKVEKLGPWLQQEYDIYVSIIEAQTTLDFLIENRANLHDQLKEFENDTDNSHAEHIKQIQNDIELQNAQISDLQQKILDYYEENKTKKRWDGIQTMAEAKLALKKLFEIIGESKKKETVKQSQFYDLTSENAELKKQLGEKETYIANLQQLHRSELAQVRQESEEKVSLLLHQLRGVNVETADEQLQQRCKIQEEIIEQLETQLKQQELKLNTVTTQLAAQAKTPPKKQKLEEPKKVVAFATPDLNVTDEVNEDNADADPDWVRTPLMRRIKKFRKDEKDDVKPIKRSSDGGCTCKKDCSSRLCGCRKLSKSCCGSCKCKSEQCKNRYENDENDENSYESTEERKPLKALNVLGEEITKRRKIFETKTEENG